MCVPLSGKVIEADTFVVVFTKLIRKTNIMEIRLLFLAGRLLYVHVLL